MTMASLSTAGHYVTTGADDNVAAQSSRRHQADDNDIVTTRGDAVGTA